MKNGSIQDRLLRLEKKRRFLDWVLQYRFLINLTPEELQTVNSGKEFCAPLGNRASKDDGFDQDLRWEKSEHLTDGRTAQQLWFFVENGIFPEQRGQFHCLAKNGDLFFEWRRQ